MAVRVSELGQLSTADLRSLGCQLIHFHLRSLLRLIITILPLGSREAQRRRSARYGFLKRQMIASEHLHGVLLGAA